MIFIPTNFGCVKVEFLKPRVDILEEYKEALIRESEANNKINYYEIGRDIEFPEQYLPLEILGIQFFANIALGPLSNMDGGPKLLALRADEFQEIQDKVHEFQHKNAVRYNSMEVRIAHLEYVFGIEI